MKSSTKRIIIGVSACAFVLWYHITIVQDIKKEILSKVELTCVNRGEFQLNNRYFRCMEYTVHGPKTERPMRL